VLREDSETPHGYGLPCSGAGRRNLEHYHWLTCRAACGLSAAPFSFFLVVLDIISSSPPQLTPQQQFLRPRTSHQRTNIPQQLYSSRNGKRQGRRFRFQGGCASCFLFQLSIIDQLHGMHGIAWGGISCSHFSYTAREICDATCNVLQCFPATPSGLEAVCV
jgi:hypothetical protein